MQKSLLLVEDEALIALAKQKQLEACGYVVSIAKSGELAIDFCNQHPVDLILMDINLGDGIDGTETAKLILEKHDIPIIFLSSHTEREIVEKTEKITSYGYVVKNEGITVLNASIKMAFKLFDMTAERSVAQENLGTAHIELTMQNESLRDTQSKYDTLKEKYFDIFNIAPVGYITINEKGVIQESNLTFAHLIGGEKQIIEHRPFSDYVFSEDINAFNQLRRKLKETRETQKIELCLVKQDKTVFWVSLKASISQQNHKDIFYFVVTDITDRKKIEDDLKLISKRYELAAQAGGVGVWELEVATGKISWDDKMLNLWGLTREEFGGTFNQDQNISELDAERIRGEMLEALKPNAKPFDSRFRVIWPDGSLHYIKVYGEAERDSDGNAIRMIGTNWDVTENKLMEQKILLSEQSYKNQFEKNIAPMLLIDPIDRAIVGANEAAQTFYGYSLDQLTSMRISDINTLPLDKLQVEMDSVINVGKRFEFQHRLADGSIRDVEVSSSPIIFNGQKILHSIIYDATAKKKADQEIKNLLKEKDLILKEVHHRVKNNLSMIVSLLSLQASSTDNEETQGALEEAGARVRSMLALYDKLYKNDFGSYGAVRLNDYTHVIVEAFRDNYFAGNGLEINCDVDDVELNIKLTQNLGIIINELLTNIAKYAFTGQTDRKIDLVIKAEYNFLTVIVSDNGVGMPEGIDFDHSTGFGLQLISGLTESIRGSLRLDREVEKGTKVIIEFRYK